MQEEAWDQLYKRKRSEQREARGARVHYQQIRQEIADLAILFIEATTISQSIARYDEMERKAHELRALEQRYPSVKELT